MPVFVWRTLLLEEIIMQFVNVNVFKYYKHAWSKLTFKFINSLFRKINSACKCLTSIYKIWKGLRKGLVHYFNNSLKVNEISFVTEGSVKKDWILKILTNLYTKTQVSGEWIKVTFPWSDLVFFLPCPFELNLLSIFTDKMNAFFFWSTIDVPILQPQSVLYFATHKVTTY